MIAILSKYRQTPYVSNQTRKTSSSHTYYKPCLLGEKEEIVYYFYGTTELAKGQGGSMGQQNVGQ